MKSERAKVIELLKSERAKVSEVPQPILHSAPNTGNELFLDYLDEIEDDDNRRQDNLEPHFLVEPVQGNEPVVIPRQPQIDQRWVTVDERNILQGARTRGNRPDYRELAAGGQG